MTWLELDTWVEAHNKKEHQYLRMWATVVCVAHNASPNVGRINALKVSDLIDEPSKTPEIMGVAEFYQMVYDSGEKVPPSAMKWVKTKDE